MLNKLSAPDCQLRRGGDSEDGEWVHLSCDPPDTKCLYQPFVDIANAVAKLDCPRADKLILFWRDTHAERPISFWSTTHYDIVPGLIAELEPVGGHEREFYAWARTVIPVEVKKGASSLPSVVKLIHYVRQIYKEQVDRRFIIGITFAKYLLTVWYFDRSGCLGSTIINVHKVRVIYY